MTSHGHDVRGLHVDNVFWVDIGEARELGLVQVHDEQFIGWGQLGRLAREFSIEVTDVLLAFLQISKQ